MQFAAYAMANWVAHAQGEVDEVDEVAKSRLKRAVICRWGMGSGENIYD